MRMNNNMKKAVLILVILICIINYQGFAQNQKNTPDPKPSVDKIPVTPYIVEYLLKSEKNSDVIFYLSESFTMKMAEQKDTAEMTTRDKKIIHGPPSPTDVEFSMNDEGILIEIPAPKGSVLKIYFKEKNKTLVFTRNIQQNCYIFSSIISLENNSYRIVPSKPIQLYVASDQNDQKIEVKVFPDNQLQFNAENNVQPYQSILAHNDNLYPPDYYYQSVTLPSRNIIGFARSSINPEGVIEYARRVNPALSRSDIGIIREYFKEAKDENVNVDIAIAQMLYATNFLRNYRMSQHNYAGLSELPSKGFCGSFYSTTDGVRAHIQHLKGYAKEMPLRKTIIDPRFDLAYERGERGGSFERLYRYWTANHVSYQQSIDKILRDLYRYSGVRL